MGELVTGSLRPMFAYATAVFKAAVPRS